ncbi:hypothetical protein E2C01_058355 [Portunus trituberculatus]|uniref:Secreted protein n=1 Tax=Portunus trituberculatus TaxID=210409 RepID=A0A5B7H5V9_PORTR|nr:hypothetical protein [Portunus trituberculatus]
MYVTTILINHALLVVILQTHTHSRAGRIIDSDIISKCSSNLDLGGGGPRPSPRCAPPPLPLLRPCRRVRPILSAYSLPVQPTATTSSREHISPPIAATPITEFCGVG